jgi:hypothetical protein
MLTKDQWVDLARFAGGKFTNDSHRRFYCDSRTLGQVRGVSPWQPDSDWNDIGPQWMKLERWAANNKTKSSYDLFDAYDNFYTAKNYGTETELMEAGCAWGAAIGATMGDKA